VLVLAGLALAAALTLRRRRRLDRLAVEIGAFALTAFGLHALLAAYPRMLIPLVPIALLAIVTGVSRPARAARV
jgi:CHASE2 domain-containing sensor protein